jgi:16S rRNA processing protein RimM
MSVVHATSLDRVGEVVDVYEVPQGLMLDVKRAQGTVLIPFRPEVIAAIDHEGRRLLIEPPEGLLD